MRESARWAEELPQRWEAEGRPYERRLVDETIAWVRELAPSQPELVLAHQDLHGGNVLRAEREPWLVIDPKPFLGDPAYDATQHLFNCDERLQSNPLPTIERFARLAGIDAERVRLWIFARAAAEPRDEWRDVELDLARRLAPR